MAPIIKTTTLTQVFFASVLLLAGCTQHFDASPAAAGNIAGNANPDPNFLAARHYYQGLIGGAAPKIAELSLFTNMLPKGGDLHHHYSGAIYVETYLDWIDENQYCICHENTCGAAGAKTKPTPKFEIVKKPVAGCVSAKWIRTEDNDFYRQLLKIWSDKDYANHFHEQSPPDLQFFETFRYFTEFFDSDLIEKNYYREGLQSLKQRAMAENVGYLETMLKGAPAVDNPDMTGSLNALTPNTADAGIDHVLGAAFDFMAGDAATRNRIDNYIKLHETAAEGIDDANFKLRFLSYVSRNTDPAKIFTGLYSAFAAANQGKPIVGVNFVGPENGYVAMRDYSLHMKMLRFLKQRFPKVKLALHAGELVMGMVPPEGLKHHINEAVSIAGADRVGHGVDVAHEIDALGLLERMKTGDTAVEINLTSNEFILGVKNEAHPLQLYRRQAVPFVISTDDAGVSRINLSNEYLLFASRYQPSYEELKAAVYNSIRYAFLSEDEKRGEVKELDRRFAVFEEKIARMAGSN